MSVCIPWHGDRKENGWLNECVRSFEDNDARLEMVVLDGTGLGISKAYNRCVDMATGDFIILFGSDDWALPHMVDKHLAAALANPDYDIVYSNYFRGPERCGPLRMVGMGQITNNFEHEIARMLQSETVPHPALYRRKVFDVVRHDETLPSGVDLEFKLQTLEHGFKWLHIREWLWVWRTGNYIRASGTEEQALGVEIARSRRITRG